MTDRQDLDCALYAFLREYWMTADSTTKVSPMSLCINRPMGDFVPLMEAVSVKHAVAADELRKLKQWNDEVQALGKA